MCPTQLNAIPIYINCSSKSALNLIGIRFLTFVAV